MILLTAFGPYGKYKENISSLIIQNLEIRHLDISIKKVIIPVSWNLSVKSYQDILNKLSRKPKIVILFGIHSNNNYHLESIGWNFAFGKDIDNFIKIGTIRFNFNLYLRPKLNIREIFSLLKERIDIKLSYFPGTYLCNYIYYWALFLSNKKYPVLFIHIPAKENLIRGVKIVSMIIKTINSVL